MVNEIAPGYTGECHPEIYERAPRSNPLKEGQLTDAQLEQYDKDGFILVENFFKLEELEPAKVAINGFVDELANKLFDGGKIKNKYEDLGFFHRLTMIEKEFPGANIILHKRGILPQAFRTIASNPRLLNLLEDFLGPDIAFGPVWNLRTKTPSCASTTVPWHQDSGYLDLTSYATLMMTAWIPLLDANEVNGTLQFVRKAHSKALVAKHTCCAGPTWYIQVEEEDMEKELDANMKDDIVTVHVPYGSFILFNNFVPHRSLMNNSDIIRWSLDLRWQKAGTPDGLWGLKKCCLLRSSEDPDLIPDWDAFDSVDHFSELKKSMDRNNSEFDTTISGPWMKKWDIVHHNRHTDSFVDDRTTWDPNVVHG